MRININKLQHIGIPVNDLNVSQAFYRRLGFENVMESAFEHKGGKGKVAMMEREEIIIEIYQMPENELYEIRNRSNGHIDHVAFDVPDIDEAFMELKENGFNVVENEPVFLPFWKNGCRYFNISGPDGERLKFNQIL